MKKLIQSQDNFVTRDPFVIKHNGKYYHCFTKDTNSIYVSCADTIEELDCNKAKMVYMPDGSEPMAEKQLWAPELHVIDGKCYIYVACDDGKNHNHRMFVLENNCGDPLQSYILHGKIKDQTDKWAIDGTVVCIDGENYFVWSGWEGDQNICQNLYIAKMKDPYTLCSERVLISAPEYDWEQKGATGNAGSPFINEGPFGLYLDGEFYLLYSAAGSWCKDYCIAALKLTGSNPLDKTSWEKGEKPIFSFNQLVVGAGHCSVVETGGTHTIFFHAWDKDEEDITWSTVSVWTAKLYKNQDGLCIE